jgi:hypothetical protein
MLLSWRSADVGPIVGIASLTGTKGSDGTFGTTRSTDEPQHVQCKRAHESGRGRSAKAPWQIPWVGWKDILWRTYQELSEDRLVAVAAGVVFYALVLRPRRRRPIHKSGCGSLGIADGCFSKSRPRSPTARRNYGVSLPAFPAPRNRSVDQGEPDRTLYRLPASAAFGRVQRSVLLLLEMVLFVLAACTQAHDGDILWDYQAWLPTSMFAGGRLDALSHRLACDPYR